MTNHTLTPLTEKVITLLGASLDALDPAELLTDRQALRNLTAALRELYELQLQMQADAAAEADGAAHPDTTGAEGGGNSGRQATAAATVVSFLGETEEMSL